MQSQAAKSRRAGGKMKLSRRVLLGSAVAPCLPRFAHAAATTWRIGHSAPAGVPMHARLLEAATAISHGSNGQMSVEVHPNGELGSPVGLLAQLRAGTIDAVPLTGQMLARDLPLTVLPSIGFVFDGYDDLWPAVDGGLGGFVHGQMMEKLGLVAMSRCWDLGFRQITTSGKRINTAADLSGLRLRTPADADLITLFQAMKALPVALPMSALSRALGSHSIDGQEGVVPLVMAAGLFRVQSVCALSNHVWDGQWLCVSGKSWSGLPAGLKDIVADALNAAALRQRIDTTQEEAGIRKKLEADGMTFNTVNPAGFRSELRRSGYYKTWRDRMGDEAWTVLEKHTGRLT